MLLWYCRKEGNQKKVAFYFDRLVLKLLQSKKNVFSFDILSPCDLKASFIKIYNFISNLCIYGLRNFCKKCYIINIITGGNEMNIEKVFMYKRELLVNEELLSDLKSFMEKQHDECEVEFIVKTKERMTITTNCVKDIDFFEIENNDEIKLIEIRAVKERYTTDSIYIECGLFNAWTLTTTKDFKTYDEKRKFGLELNKILSKYGMNYNFIIRWIICHGVKANLIFMGIYFISFLYLRNNFVLAILAIVLIFLNLVEYLYPLIIFDVSTNRNRYRIKRTIKNILKVLIAIIVLPIVVNLLSTYFEQILNYFR